MSKEATGDDRYKETTYNTAGVIQYSNTYDRYHSRKKSEVSYCKYYPSGQLHIQREMHKGKRHGRFLSYWENGTLKRKDYYIKGMFGSGTCWDESGKEVSYYPFEEPAEYPGGMVNIITFIKNSIDPKYNTSRYKGSRVLVKFAILENGKVSEIEIVGGGPVELLVEAVRLVESMPAWTPGKLDGEPIKTRHVLPIVF
ncbi:energy transducer TonB [Robertkochia sediminum]|uniref:energy transducer TonB n=1 Tax=Robertkochia sediminum TaxID=2785326 RepID=UPI0019349087|nr:energy transducer TonB [Robertkochia sediminum]MBL7472096.1 energy transducer TonB [Robertkochia sediminum]